MAVEPERDHWFEPIADHLDRAYLRYSFTKGTRQEIDFLVSALGLRPAQRVLDVGCGPGRHAHELARRGIEAHGVDISRRFVELAEADAPPGATFERLDARSLPFDAEFDVAMSLCQGAFGLLAGVEEDREVLEAMRRSVRPGGRVVVSAFSAYFQVRHRGEGSVAFDAATGIHHERTEVRDPDGRAVPVELWTHCFTPTELRLLAGASGLRVDAVWSVDPGAYGPHPPDIETTEFLLVATKPHVHASDATR